MSTKLALVTGAGKRLGQEIAIYLAKSGYDIIVHYSKSYEGALITESKIKELGRTAHLIQADLAESYAPKEILSEVSRVFGRLDLLVNSASAFPDSDKIISRHTFEKEDEETWSESMAVNARAPFFLIKYSSPLLTESKQGLVINLLDLFAKELAVSRTAHALSKGTLKSVTELAAKSFGEKFRVCSLLLGNIIPGEKMSEEERNKISWVGVPPVLKMINRIIQSGESGKCYEVL